MIKKISVGMLCLLYLSNAFAQSPPLVVAASQYAPPFVMQGKNQLFGFDIAMMNYICSKIQRECRYQIMPFDALLTAITTGKADVAIGSITITLDRAKMVNFSIPYFPSQSQFIGPKKFANASINNTFLKDKSVGIKTGSVFIAQLRNMGLADSSISSYKLDADLIEALTSGDIDLALIDEPAAQFWQNQSSGALVEIGTSFSYGGLGIGVIPSDLSLLQNINNALAGYLKSADYKTNYEMYLSYLQ